MRMLFIFNVIPTKTHLSFLLGLDKLILKFIGENKHIRIARKVLKKRRNKDRTNPNRYQTFYTISIIKTVWYWSMHRQRPLAQNRKSGNRPKHT